MTFLRIPLFPLPLVLFPHANLPLHIFEPRYKQMIRECIDHPSEFGIVLIREGGAMKIGCTAAVVEVTRQYDDGRMDIQVEGGSAFEIQEVFKEKPYLEARIELLAEDGDPKTAKIPQDLLDLYGQCHMLLFGSDPEAIDRDENESVAFAIADSLPLDLEEKQIILAMRNENERLARLVPMLQQLVPRAEVRHRMRQKAGGNGHAGV
jgi:Lon protease-like protein